MDKTDTWENGQILGENSVALCLSLWSETNKNL